MAAVLATGCIPAGGYGGTYTQGSYGQPQPTVEAGVWVNGQQLSNDDKAKLDWLLGATLPDGRYFVTDSGMMGREGQQATVDLIAYAKARGVYQQPTANHNTAARGSYLRPGYSGDGIVSDGKGCTIISTSTGSFSSGC
jgi:hypothetical protein